MIHNLPNGVIHETRAEDVYPLLIAGSISLVHSDGPYAVGKADWDRMKVADLAAWYRPHIEAWGRLCAPSASIYHWGTAEGWAAVHPEYLRQGWKFKTLIAWDKVISSEMLGDTMWPDTTEVCGVYLRGDPACEALKDGTRVNARGNACLIGNVWRQAVTAAGFRSERLRGAAALAKVASDPVRDDPLHPCQKPLKFADRIIRASSRPGQIVLEPFGGTCRIAVACEQIARYKPADARRYICVEMNADGVDYIGPVLKQIQDNARQVTLFERAV